MEQYTTATTTTGEQIVVQTTNGQIQQQVSSGCILYNENAVFLGQNWNPLLWGLGIQKSQEFQILCIFPLIIWLRLKYPALPAGAGHSNGCAAANWGASGDGLRPAGADTPGSGVTSSLCRCHECYSPVVCMLQPGLFFHDPSLCCLVHPLLLSMCYSCLNCMLLSTMCGVVSET